ncbi:MAG TPA: DUF692 domain-containing protein [Dongiaceae bacterium]|jgi:hypothetical protein|nr:DUF692 domain-containing protein [Dongiaceae bacterium]
MSSLPCAAGIGLRQPHHAEFLAVKPAVAWIEVHSENFMGGGPTLDLLEKLRADYPISLHGVGLSLGSAEGVSATHLERLALLVERIAPAEISDHLSWSVTGGNYYNDLLPLPYTEEALAVVADNVARVQDRLGRRLLVENPSTYLEYDERDYSEPEFLRQLCRRTGCAILLDINNIIVCGFNHGYPADRYLAEFVGVPVGEYHLAGHHTRMLGNRGLKIDDHGSAVGEEVWRLYAHAVAEIGAQPTLIERDSNIPPLAELLAEAARADQALAL